MKIDPMLLAVCLAVLGCGSEGEQPRGGVTPQEEVAQLQVQLAPQKEKTRSAEATYHRETKRLQAMQDSLQVEITRNIALGLSRERATAVEQARIDVQRALVKAEHENLARQRDYLVLLKKRLRTLTGKP